MLNRRGTSASIRPCPLCASKEITTRTAFPYAVEFDDQRFSYFRCASCKSVFIDPLPNEQTFARMYAKSQYHDCHYSGCASSHYDSAAHLLAQFAPPGSTVLDYGCGVGHFLRSVQSAGFLCMGVEFDAAAASTASQNAGCDVLPVSEFARWNETQKFDVLHLGDVLEHLPDPAGTLTHLLSYLKAGGLLFAEGPLEVNPSPVYWAARTFGMMKRRLRPSFTGRGTPTHLFRAGAQQQLRFFQRITPQFERLHWAIYETGWPYADGGLIKRGIARVAISMGGKRFGGTIFGNRFIAIFRVVADCAGNS